MYRKSRPKILQTNKVDSLLGDATQARELLKWTPKISFNKLVKEMIDYDLMGSKS